MKASAAIATGADWREALAGLEAELGDLSSEGDIDLALLFASAAYVSDFDQLLAEVRRLTGARVLLGCSGNGIIGPGREIEGEPALALQVFSLPGADLRTMRLDMADLDDANSDWFRNAPPAEGTDAWLVFSDPFTLDAEKLLARMSEIYEDVPIVGGMASGDPRSNSTHLFLNDEVLEEGAIGLALGGAYTVKTVVSQGCAPIGETWTITGAHDNIVETIGMRPAVDVLYETFRALAPEIQERAQSNLLVGLAMDEYKDEFNRGDFLIRNLLGLDEETGSIAIGAKPREGQTLQFQLRDPQAADEDLDALLNQAQQALAEKQPVGALLCCCNGRGAGLFGTPNHDIKKMEEVLGPVPVTGFFCNGEIGPIGGRNYLHGFTASLALILPKEDGA